MVHKCLFEAIMSDKIDLDQSATAVAPLLLFSETYSVLCAYVVSLVTYSCWLLARVRNSRSHHELRSSCVRLGTPSQCLCGKCFVLLLARRAHRNDDRVCTLILARGNSTNWMSGAKRNERERKRVCEFAGVWGICNR